MMGRTVIGARIGQIFTRILSRRAQSGRFHANQDMWFRKTGALAVLMLLGLLLMGCVEKVAFVSQRDGHGQIYTMDKNGNAQTNISNTSRTEHFPDISPNGEKIVFSSFRDVGENIFIMDLEGQNIQQVTNGSGQHTQPRWSQNDLIAFIYPAYHKNAKIWTINPDGTELHQITSPGPDESDGSGHDFYNGGERIVFSRYNHASQRRDLYLIGADGTGLQQLTETADISEVLPVVSHDGRLLAFRAFFHTNLKETIRILNVSDWSLVNEITLPPPAANNISGLDFSKDDQRLYVSVEVDDVAGTLLNIKQEIFSIKTDGTELVRMTNNSVSDTWPISIAPTEQFVMRTPVLFIHGHSRSAEQAWQQPGATGTTSFSAVLAANPNLPVDAFYLELPLRGNAHPENFDRSIARDAEDILAAIEGGPDSTGEPQIGILNRPEYQNGRVALVGYSQGGISSRYYLKNLMGSRKNGRITVTEFVSLATPNHGVGGVLTCGDKDQPDRSSRELCGGRTATVVSQIQSCGSCLPSPAPFNTNLSGDDAFIEDLNGHGFAGNCNPSSITNPQLEAPRSRPSTPAGVLYVNLYAASNGDLIAGGHEQSADCLGRHLARNHAPDVINTEISGVPVPVHANFPHYWPVICHVLRTVSQHQAPADPASACQGLTTP